jgi:sulfoxide reductase heme-binding subunit YedZ
MPGSIVTGRWLKGVVGGAAMIPAALTGFWLFTDGLGANPIENALNKLGLWTLILLLAGLACTPLKVLFGWKWPLKVRKMLGLCAFVYACLHFSFYVVVDKTFSWDEILEDITKRKFITVGFAALVLLVPLAVTSTSKMVKRMGFPRWKNLHRLVYVAATLGIIHFMWRVKADLLEPLIYAGVLAVLFLVRVVAFVRERGRGGAATSSSAAE